MSLFNRVFIIGMFRTGTSSVADALRTLDYKVTSRPWFVLKDKEGNADNCYDDPDNWPKFFPEIQERAKQFTGFSDAPWLFLYKEIDKWFPGSKFILTLRRGELVARSERNAWSKNHKPEGVPSDTYFIKRYNHHNKLVSQYFNGRNDFIIMNLPRGDGWHKLCRFLNKSVPNKKFPHSNRGRYK